MEYLKNFFREQICRSSRVALKMLNLRNRTQRNLSDLDDNFMDLKPKPDEPGRGEIEKKLVYFACRRDMSWCALKVDQGRF